MATRPRSNSLSEQLRVVGAVLLRELHTRYGRENIGYLWLFAEPMMLASVITVVHVNQATHYASDMDPAPFAIIGYTTFIIFRGMFNRAEGAIEQNQSMLYHRQVSLFDIMFAKGIIELAGCGMAMIFLLGFAYMVGLAQLPYRPLYLLGAVGLMAWWSFALSLIAAAASYRNELVGRQLHVISYFSIPISAMFFTLQWVPASLRAYLQWFPMPLILEQARYGMFRSASADYVSPGYVSASCAVLLYLGLLMLRRLRRRLHV